MVGGFVGGIGRNFVGATVGADVDGTCPNLYPNTIAAVIDPMTNSNSAHFSILVIEPHDPVSCKSANFGFNGLALALRCSSAARSGSSRSSSLVMLVNNFLFDFFCCFILARTSSPLRTRVVVGGVGGMMGMPLEIPLSLLLLLLRAFSFSLSFSSTFSSSFVSFCRLLLLLPCFILARIFASNIASSLSLLLSTTDSWILSNLTILLFVDVRVDDDVACRSSLRLDLRTTPSSFSSLSLFSFLSFCLLRILSLIRLLLLLLLTFVFDIWFLLRDSSSFFSVVFLLRLGVSSSSSPFVCPS